MVLNQLQCIFGLPKLSHIPSIENDPHANNCSQLIHIQLIVLARNLFVFKIFIYFNCWIKNWTEFYHVTSAAVFACFVNQVVKVSFTIDFVILAVIKQINQKPITNTARKTFRVPSCTWVNMFSKNGYIAWAQ